MREKVIALVFLLLLSGVPVKPFCATHTENGVTASMPDLVNAGEEFLLTLQTSHYVPGGGFWRVQVTWADRPEGKAPEVLTGMPKTDIRILVPGKYTCTVETGIVTKGSCGGVTYDKISIHTFEIEAK